MEIPILYEDRHLLLCLKPAGLVSEEGGLVDRLREQKGGEIFCVHRLDREAAGLMVYARSRPAAAELSRLIAAGELQKTYLAAVSGRPEADQGVLRDLLFRDAGRNKSYVVRRRRKGVREAELRYRLLDSRDGLSLLEIELVTGRSHQIRVQFASRGLPLAGDRKYGSPVRDCPLALWSCRLAFPAPFGGAPLAFSAPPPALRPWTGFTLPEL